MREAQFIRQRIYGRAAGYGIAALTLRVAVANAQLSPEAIARLATPAVARIAAYGADNAPLKFGSGFLVDGGKHLVTNAHVLRDAFRIEVVLPDKSVFRSVRVLAYRPDVDLAIIGLDASRASSLMLADDKERISVGAAVYVVGNPLGLEGTFSNGLVSGWRKRGAQNLIQITAPISPGSSGGPVLSSTGQVIAVATASLSDGQNLNFAVAVKQVRALLASLGSQPKALHLPLGAGPGRTAKDATSSLLATLGSYPLMWGVTDVKERLGEPDSEVRDVFGNNDYLKKLYGPRVGLDYRRSFFGRPGTLSIIVDPQDGVSSGAFLYDTDLADCSKEYLRLKKAFTAELGSPSRVTDNGTCGVLVAEWNHPDTQRRYSLTVVGVPAFMDAPGATRVIITYSPLEKRN